MALIPSWRGALPAFPRPLVLATALTAAVAAAFSLAFPSAPPPAPAELALPAAAADLPAEPAPEIVGVQAGDTFASLLAARGIDTGTVHAIMSSGAATRVLSAIRAGSVIELMRDRSGQVQELSYSPDPLRKLTVRRNTSGTFDGELVEKPTVTVTRYADGVIEDSLFSSGKRAGVSDGVILKMADIFAYDIDFALEVQQGDTFRVMFEEVLVDGQRIRDGEILSAEFVNQGKTYRAVRFDPGTGKATYYTPDGMAMRKAFLRSPVDFARISSRFNLKRKHPLLHTLRAHKGVDYAAARGTPVRATADGRVETAGNKGGYGRTVVLQHGNRVSTLYAHLDRLAGNLRNGSRVSQGQIIGYVGSTGLSTGPHLHYEFRVAGTHTDPLKVKTIQAEPIAAANKQAFLTEATRLFAMMDTYSGGASVAHAGTAKPSDQSRL